MKVMVSGLLVFMLLGFVAQSDSVDGLSVDFKRISEQFTLSMPIPNPMGPNYLYTNTIEAKQGRKFVRMKLVFKNEGAKDCIFDMEDVYISTPQDSLCRSFQDGYTSKISIKPQKKINKIVYFEFPKEVKPKELFVEDKRYPIPVIGKK